MTKLKVCCSPTPEGLMVFERLEKLKVRYPTQPKTQNRLVHVYACV